MHHRKCKVPRVKRYITANRGPIITCNLDIISNFKLLSLICFDTKYRIPAHLMSSPLLNN